MKTICAIFISIILMLASALIVQSYYFSFIKNDNKTMRTQIDALNENLKKALSKDAISFSISPEIKNSVTSTFGSTKNVTMQYYFTLDGKAILTKPDSTYHIVKEYK